MRRWVDAGSVEETGESREEPAKGTARKRDYKEALGYHLGEGKRLVEECGYHRRDPEVMLIQAELAIVDDNRNAARKKLQEAKKWIDDMGMHRWDTEVERLKRRL